MRTRPSGLGPTAEFISLLSHKETNQRNGSLPGAFMVFLGAVGFAFVQWLLVGNRLEPIAVRRCGVCGRRVVVVTGKYDGGLRATGVSQKLVKIGAVPAWGLSRLFVVSDLD